MDIKLRRWAKSDHFGVFGGVALVRFDQCESHQGVLGLRDLVQNLQTAGVL